MLQDDITVVPQFTESLAPTIRAKPDHAIAFYVNGNSPENSYLVRQAAVLGSSWVRLSLREWTPALALALPASQALELSRYLAEFPDDFRDDDELITVFCRERKIPVVATVPHLLDHMDGESLAGNGSHGVRRATVLIPDDPTPRNHWESDPGIERRMAERIQNPGKFSFAVEFTGSTCLLRFIRPGTDELLEHPFGWYWWDWCDLIDIPGQEIITACERYLKESSGELKILVSELGERVFTEFWAACYILGFDSFQIARILPLLTEYRAKIARGALNSWLVSGLRAEDSRCIAPGQRDVLVDAGIEAVRHGMRTAASRAQ
ncbi:hypothetical protein [Streptomyces sp. MB09-02B]|uniref:hypothetical protein n=1 Tax=Streptomyces sp. MB09-02B TaxID=3028667 RepID=UPI0029AB837D|nr:hypothetical protein [Streptomyces sp. MB09-02B]MDX3638421.1 hypothetical protein [Streptomyces sp. MB09-02B]